MDTNNSRSSPGLTWLVLTKDRALQLDALLRSVKESVGCAVQFEVLYKATSDRHFKAYNEVFSRHADLVPQPRRETKFNRDIIKMVSAMRGDRVAFLVDDLVFVSPVDLGLVLAVDPRVATYSFRLGRRIVRCHPLGISTGHPPFVKPQRLPEQWLAWPWSMGKGDWWVRNSLDGNVLSRDLPLAGLYSNRNFEGPQSLEAMLCICGYGTELGIGKSGGSTECTRNAARRLSYRLRSAPRTARVKQGCPITFHFRFWGTCGHRIAFRSRHVH